VNEPAHRGGQESPCGCGSTDQVNWSPAFRKYLCHLCLTRETFLELEGRTNAAPVPEVETAVALTAQGESGPAVTPHLWSAVYLREGPLRLERAAFNVTVSCQMCGSVPSRHGALCPANLMYYSATLRPFGGTITGTW